MCELLIISIPNGTCVFLTMQLKIMYFGVCFKSIIFVFFHFICISYLIVCTTRVFGACIQYTTDIIYYLLLYIVKISNSPTASQSDDCGGGPSQCLKFRSPSASFLHLLFSYSLLSACLLFLYIFYHSWCSRGRLFGEALVHEFLVSYSCAERCLRFSDNATRSCVFWSVYSIFNFFACSLKIIGVCI